MTRTVLVVDDDPDVRELVVLSLSGAGWLVDAAADGREALLWCREHEVDAVVLDLEMPELDGRGTLTALRADARTSGLPVVFLTAATDPALRAELIALGAEEVLAKPFDPLALPDRIADAVGWLTTTCVRPEAPPPAA